MTKKEILKLLEPFDDNVEICIQYSSELKLELNAVTNHLVTHLGETIRKDTGPNDNCGLKIFVKE